MANAGNLAVPVQEQVVIDTTLIRLRFLMGLTAALNSIGRVICPAVSSQGDSVIGS